MGSPKQTTVVLNETVQKIKDELSPIYGLKNILSASLLIFSKLTAEEQKQAVAEASEKKIAPEPKKSLQNMMGLIKEMTEVEKQQPGTIYRVLSPAEQKTMHDFIKAVGPDQPKQKKKTKRA